MKKLYVSMIALAMSAQVVAQGPQQPPAQVVVSEVIETELNQEITVTGRVVSPNATQAVAEVTGRVVYSAQIGELVPKGEMVYQIDTEVLELRYTEQKALVQRAKLQTEYYQKEHDRLKTLGTAANVSANALDESAYRLGVAKQDLTIANARLAMIADEIERARYIAPHTLVVSERMVKTGEFVNRGQAVVAMHNPHQVELLFELPIVWRHKVITGDQYKLSTAAGHELDVTVSHVVAAANERSQTFQVKAQLAQNQHAVLALNEIVSVVAVLPVTDESVAIPRDAVVLRQGGTFVYQIDEAEGVAKQVPVQLGKGTEEYVSFKGELTPGAKVAIRGAERLRDGQKVVIKG